MRQPLGRGLDAILGGAPAGQEKKIPAAPQAEARPGADEQKEKIHWIPTERVMAGRGQPRRHFEDEALDDLAASIRENGILQPLVAVENSGSYELIAGERRLRAAVRAGLDRVPVILREASSEAGMLELALVENLQREDLGPMERARAYERLVQAHGLSPDDIARKVGKSRVAVANTLRLNGLPGPVLDALEKGLLSEGQARPLLALKTATRQIEAMQAVIRRGLSVRDTEQMVRDWGEASDGAKAGRTKAAKKAPSELESSLGRVLGTKVRLRGGGRKGRIEIEYYSQEELTRLIDFLSSREGR